MGRAIFELPFGQREALILVGVGGFSYEEAAQISSVAVGTIKSRVCRARATLEERLERNESFPSQGQRPMVLRSKDFCPSFPLRAPARSHAWRNTSNLIDFSWLYARPITVNVVPWDSTNFLAFSFAKEIVATMRHRPALRVSYP